MPGPRSADKEQIQNTWNLFVEPGSVIEVRILDAGKFKTVSGYFDNGPDLVKNVQGLNADSPGIYFTVNPVLHAVRARAYNRLNYYAKNTTTDKEIQCRRWLYIDIDPERPTGISSTDAEHNGALDLARRIKDHLTSLGWPDPILADSGNGAHLHYRIDLPNDDNSKKITESCLKSLSRKFTGQGIKVDEAVFNAARICKLYGTMARKGDSLVDRPNRMSKLLESPACPAVVPLEKLVDLAGKFTPAAEQYTPPRHDHSSNFDVSAWINKQELKVSDPKLWNGGNLWELAECPFDSNHKKSARITQAASGAIGFQCFHNSCKGNDWRKLRRLLGDDVGKCREYSRADSSPTSEEDKELFTPSDHWKLLDVSLVKEWATDPLQPLIDGIVAKGNFVFVAAQSQTGKTLLWLYVARYLVHGGLLFGKYQVTPGSKVVYLILEDPGRRIQERILDTDHEFLPIPPGQFQVAVWPGFVITDLSLFGYLRTVIAEQQFDVVVLDTYQRATPGITSFDDEKQSTALHRLAALTRETGITLVVIDHIRKTSNASNSNSKSLSLDDVKGTGGKAQNADCVILMERTGKGRSQIKLQAFSKDFDQPVGILLDIAPKGSQEPKFQFVCDLAEMAEGRKRKGEETSQKIREAMCSGQWLSSGVIAEKCKLNTENVRRHLKNMEDKGEVGSFGEGKGKKYKPIPPDSESGINRKGDLFQ